MGTTAYLRKDLFLVDVVQSTGHQLRNEKWYIVYTIRRQLWMDFKSKCEF